MLYGIIENWSNKNQEELILLSGLVVGDATPRLSTTGDMAILKFDEQSSVFDDPDITAYTLEEIKDELNTEVWSLEL